jgi:hypothetical protein
VSTFDRLPIAIVTARALTATASVDCGGSSSECFRYSDCASGLTCAAGKCVAPPPQAPSDDGSADAGAVLPVLTDAGTSEATELVANGAQSGGDAPAE